MKAKALHPQVEFEVVVPRTHDAPQLAQMHYQSWLDTYVGLQPELTREWVTNYASERNTEEGIKRREAYFKEAKSNPERNLYYLAKNKEGTIIGFVSAHKDQGSQELGGLYVAKEYQGTGVAQALMERFLSWLRTDDDAFLWVARSNPRAIRFYEKYGFKIVRDAEKPHKENSPLIIVKMVRKGDET